jgi:hypothetical protein
MASDLREYRSVSVSLAAVIGSAMFFLWISGGTQFHQLAIGIMISTVTLTLALALFELCWRLALSVASFFDAENRN